MLELAQFQQLQLGQVVPADFLSQSIRQVQKDSATTYFFESDEYSFPHRVVVSTEGKIVEVAVHIPVNLRENYLQEMQQLGAPDYSFSLSEYETQNVFIQGGKLFTLDESGKVIMVTTANPERIQSVVNKIQAKTEEPVEQLNEEDFSLTPTITNTSEVAKTPPSADILSSKLASGLIVIGVIGLVILVVVYLNWSKRRGSRPTQTTEQIPPPSVP